jgi:hypothetical protein
MSSNRKRILDFALFNDLTSFLLYHLSPITTSESRIKKQITRSQQQIGHNKPFKANKCNGINLIAIGITNTLQSILQIHILIDLKLNGLIIRILFISCLTVKQNLFTANF